MALVKTLVSVTKKVVRNLAGMGLEGAGQLVFGDRWPFFEKVLGPVIEALEEQFPLLKASKAEAEEAADALSLRPELVNLLEVEYQKNFAELEEGQDEILKVLLGHGEVLEELRQASAEGAASLKEIGTGVDEALRRLKQLQGRSAVAPGDIPLEVDSLQ